MLDDANLINEDYDKKKSYGTQFVTSAGDVFATSLFWQQLQNTEEPLAEIAEVSSGILEGSDLFCIRQGRAPQFGICVSKEGYKPGILSGAISVSSALSDKSSFLAVFKVSTGWWYVCSRNDIILADGDILFLNEEDAKEQFYSMLDAPNWDLKIAPEEWGIGDTTNIDLESLLKRGSRVKLEKINALRGSKLILVVVGAVLAGAWVLSQLVDFVFKAIPKKPVEQPVKVVQKQQPAPEPPEPKPWENIVNPSDVMRQCFEGTQALVKILPPGWHIGGIACTPNSITTSWNREIGYIWLIDKALDESGLPFSSRSISPNGSQVMVSLPITNITTINSAPNRDTTNLVNTLNNMFQSLGLQISLGTTTFTTPRNNVYPLVTFGFSSNHDPRNWNDFWIKFPGLEIKSVKYDTNSKIWQYEGAIYALQ